MSLLLFLRTHRNAVVFVIAHTVLAKVGEAGGLAAGDCFPYDLIADEA